MEDSIVFVFIDDITSTGGTERVAAFLVNGLVAAGKKVKLISLECKNNKPGFEISSLVEVIYLNSKSLFILSRFLKRNQCDKIISISMGRLSFKITFLHNLLRLKSGLILSEHTSYEASKIWIRALKLITYQFADCLVLLTRHDYNLLLNKVRADCQLIVNASSFQKIDCSRLDKKEKIVLAIGRLDYGKGFDRLIDIWASIDNHMGWRLRIVGDGEEYTNLKSRIDNYGLDFNVELVASSRTIEQEYFNASLLVMTSRFEGLPLVLIESKSFAVPTVAFDCKTGPREIIKNNIDGFLIADGDNELFKEKLVLLMKDMVLLRRMQLESLLSSDSYTKEEVIRKWLLIV